MLLHSRVKRMIGIDYSQGAVERCRSRVQSSGITNVEVSEGSITHIPLSDCSVDKVLCLSVLQYVDDTQLKQAFVEFRRILKDDGTLVLHVKNLSSLYLFTVWLGQRVKLLLGRPSRLSRYRSYRWYAKTLISFGFQIVDYNSFNVFTLPKMPRRLVVSLQELELRNYRRTLMRLGWIRRRGADLKIKARLKKESCGSLQTLK
jgi:ubiquinone/menaquinone biosynthesis C-methylase UbiE